MSNSGTGSYQVQENYKTKLCNFNGFTVVIRLTPDDKFVDIEEIRINKDFLSIEQKATLKGFHEVDEYYKES